MEKLSRPALPTDALFELKDPVSEPEDGQATIYRSFDLLVTPSVAEWLGASVVVGEVLDGEHDLVVVADVDKQPSYEEGSYEFEVLGFEIVAVDGMGVSKRDSERLVDQLEIDLEDSEVQNLFDSID